VDTLVQTPIPCLLMRGRTSKGPFFKASDLPADVAVRDRVLLAAMGSPDQRQIDGLGGFIMRGRVMIPSSICKGPR
jgi:4-oxalomesaconate tautomerase